MIILPIRGPSSVASTELIPGLWVVPLNYYISAKSSTKDVRFLEQLAKGQISGFKKVQKIRSDQLLLPLSDEFSGFVGDPSTGEIYSSVKKAIDRKPLKPNKQSMLTLSGHQCSIQRIWLSSVDIDTNGTNRMQVRRNECLAASNLQYRSDNIDHIGQEGTPKGNLDHTPTGLLHSSSLQCNKQASKDEDDENNEDCGPGVFALLKKGLWVDARWNGMVDPNYKHLLKYKNDGVRMITTLGSVHTAMNESLKETNHFQQALGNIFQL